ncbi:MAG: FTR1 family protein [Moraxella sp.]|uniref:FTR1 family protein n=1 Tax=Moraxella sp. TaxID=479 RepID=UPI0026DC440C|nr:FTR1 family protein [Moraxella sp.]MDO4449596.1 FTR1 family protein [Moraxella sp.]
MKLVKILAIWLTALMLSVPAFADNQSEKLNFSPVFIPLSDAMGAVKNGEMDKAKDDLALIENELMSIAKDDARQSALFYDVQNALNTARTNPSEQTLKQLSVQLYAYEKEQNPVDYTAKRANFAKKITPALDKLSQEIDAFANAKTDIATVKSAYDVFNRTWVANERVVRNTSMAHYGKIETAMAMIRVGIENSPPNTTMMGEHLAILTKTIDSYNQGDEVQTNPNEQKVDLAYGVGLLERGLDELGQGNLPNAQAHLGEFIQIWATIEGDVRTRDAKLYTDIESQIPIIMAKGDKSSQANLKALIERLKVINPNARYSWVDAMLILLREGLEALLIVMALLTALTVANQPKGKKWVIAGVGAGLVASLVGAVALQQLFPAMTSGANREALEGVVGIFAVVMMIGVGVWLHSKSSVKAWNSYINKHMGVALSTGSMAGLFGLSFLSVFREGAETILFYAGILPSIAMSDFVMGIGVTLMILAVVAIIMAKTSVKLPIPHLFKILTWLIYALGFKILGVSISALQLTGHLPRNVLDFVAVPLLGIYPSVQGIMMQGLYVVAVVIMIYHNQRKMTQK